MKILQVTPGYTPELGGVELHVQSMSEALVECGHEVVVATLTTNRELPRQEIIGGVEVRRFAALGPDAYKYPIGLFHYLREQSKQFDIIHAHNYHALPALQAALACGGRAIITPHYHGHGHTPLMDMLHQLYDPCAMAVMRRVGGMICVSPSEADLVARHFQIARSKIAVIPNITIGSNAAADVTVGQISRKANQGHLLLSVGRLDSYKRVDHIIAAMPYLSAKFELAIIGTGPEEDNLQQMTHHLGVHDRVNFLGRVSDETLRIWYRHADIAISLSTSEAFGRVVVESLAAGCFVACSDIPAFSDFATEFPKAVSLIASGMTPSEVAATIQTLAEQQPTTISLQRYSWQTILANLKRVYTDIATSTIPNGLSVSQIS